MKGAYFAETSFLADKYSPAGEDGLHASWAKAFVEKMFFRNDLLGRHMIIWSITFCLSLTHRCSNRCSMFLRTAVSCIAYVFLGLVSIVNCLMFLKGFSCSLKAILLVRAALGRVYVETRYTKWRGGRLKRMVSAKHVVREGKYDSVPWDFGWMPQRMACWCRFLLCWWFFFFFYEL